MYIPGKSLLIAYALETGTITESTDGVAAATLPAIPSSPTIIGYLNQTPQADENFNPEKKYGGGTSIPVSDADGNFNPEIAFELAYGSVSFLENACLLNASDDLPYVAIFVILKGIQTIVYRFCKNQELNINIRGDSAAQEVTANVRFPAITVEYDGPVLTPTVSTVKAVGSRLYFGDVRQAMIQSVDQRKWFGGMNINVTREIERKNSRPNFGQGALLANTAYELLVNTQQVSGNLMFHDRLSDSLFRGSATARMWGDMTVPIANTAGSKSSNFTIKNMVPQIRRINQGDVRRQISHSIPYLADDLLISGS